MYAILNHDKYIHKGSVIMVDLKLWEQVPNHEKFEHLSDKAKNALIQSMIDDETYRKNEGQCIISSDIMGRPSDVKMFEKLD